MKKLIAILILTSFAFLHANSQSFVSEENTWNVMTTGFPGFLGTESYMIDGDSSQNGHDYKIIWMTMDSVDVSWSYLGLLREDANIVYYVPPGEDEGILYNYNLAVGDTAWIVNMFCYYEEVPAVIIAVDTIEYFDVPRKRMTLYAEWGYPEYWIEGIGSNLGPLHSLYSLCIACPTWDLLCFHSSGQQLYQMPGTNKCYVTGVGIGEEDFEGNVQIFPNPVRDKFEVRSVEFEIEGVVIFDLSGKKIYEQQFAGSENNVEVDVGDLESGMYVCRIFINGHQLSRKIIIN